MKAPHQPWLPTSLGSPPALAPHQPWLPTFSDPTLPRGQHLSLFSVLLGRGVKTLAQLKAGNLSVTS